MNAKMIEVLQFVAQLQAAWSKDRRSLEHFPQKWRPSIGLGLIVDRFDHHAISNSEHVFLPNRALTWIAMRDVPAMTFQRERTLSHSGASLVDRTQATFVHGMPRLDFTQKGAETCDFRRLPDHSLLYFQRFARNLRPDVLDARFHSREWTVINHISETMTSDAAYTFASGYAKPYERRWAARRWRTRGTPPESWMPRAYFQCRPQDMAYLQSAMRRVLLTANRIHGKYIIELPELAPNLLILACLAGRRIAEKSSGLWWNVQPAERYLNCELESFVFPPLPVVTPLRLRWPLPGDVELVADLPLSDEQLVAATNTEVPSASAA
jgi:hypothetical protein